MNLRDKLGGRLRLCDVKALCEACRADDCLKSELFAMTSEADNRIAYNALWVFSHFDSTDRRWLGDKRDRLIDGLLATGHVGRRRLALTLLDALPFAAQDVRTDYLDFCFSKINSGEPYAIRALCMKQALAHCRLFPELAAELEAELELLATGEMSPGLRSARRNVLRGLSRLNRRPGE